MGISSEDLPLDKDKYSFRERGDRKQRDVSRASYWDYSHTEQCLLQTVNLSYEEHDQNTMGDKQTDMGSYRISVYVPDYE